VTKIPIAYILQSFMIGGYETALYNISNKLKDEFDIHFIATGNADIHPHFYKVGKPIYIDNWDSVTNYLIKNKITIVQYGNVEKYKNCAIKAGVPIIIERTAGPRSCNNNRDGVTHVISSTKGTVPLIRSNYEGPTSIIYNGVDLDEYDKVKPERFKFSDKDFIILYSARYGRGQAFDVLIKAVMEVRKQHDVKLVLVGGPPKIKGAEDISSEIRKWVKPLGNNCILTGFLLDPKPAMAGADLYVCPARHHGISNSIIESCALGKPIVATDVGQTNEIVHDGHNGALVRVNDISAIKDNIINMINLPRMRARMGHYGRGLVKRDFNINIQAEKYRELYKNLVASI
jgi:glycosyltransferase involved in cell wall biosynthesis